MAFFRTKHLELKLNVREIPEDYPELILTESKRKFRNTLKDREIFVANLLYHGKTRPMALITERKGVDIWFITVFPITEREIINRMQRRRWKPL